MLRELKTAFVFKKIDYILIQHSYLFCDIGYAYFCDIMSINNKNLKPKYPFLTSLNYCFNLFLNIGHNGTDTLNISKTTGRIRNAYEYAVKIIHYNYNAWRLL